ncbi:MAG: ABC transporter substrate-binding protein [Rhodocyclaceae bacterium]|nr:ABC transporter substrate-binding protein [Rhodocyclaceae bacterium]MBX3668750.1 ABC transporter substrate-binding protein [Rhodocyclaceae bacterium]
MSSPLADALGRVHAQAEGEPRIVSLVPSLTELLCELGLTQYMVGRSGFCVHPRGAVARIPKMGGTKTPNLPAILAAEPTHLIVNIDENRREHADYLAAHIPHIVVTHPCQPEDNRTLLRLFGALFGALPEVERRAAELEAGFDAAWTELQASCAGLPRLPVLYLIWRSPWMTVSRATYISSLLAAAGLDTLPAVADARYPQFEWDADWVASARHVLLSSEPYRFRTRHLAEVESCCGLRAHLVDGEMLSWYGARAVAGLRYLAALRRQLDAAGNVTRRPMQA